MFKRFKQIIGAKELVKEQVGNYFYYGSCRWEENDDLKILDSKKVETIFSINTYATNSMKLILESIKGKKEYHLEKLPEANDSAIILNVVDFESNYSKSIVILNEEVAFFRFPNENMGFYFSKDNLTQLRFTNSEEQIEEVTQNKTLEDFQLDYHTISVNNFDDLNYISTLQIPHNISRVIFNKCYINQVIVDIMNFKLFDISKIEFNDCELENRNWSNQDGAVYDMTSRKKFRYIKTITVKNVDELKQLIKIVDEISSIELNKYAINQEFIDIINNNYWDSKGLNITMKNYGLTSLSSLLKLNKVSHFGFEGITGKLEVDYLNFIENTKARSFNLFYKFGTSEEIIDSNEKKLQELKNVKLNGWKTIMTITKIDEIC